MDRQESLSAEPEVMRAVLVSHFPPSFTNESLIPKMKEVNVQVLRTVNVERSPEFKMGDADILIIMKDLMSHASFDVARAVARRHAKPFVALSRKASDWAKLLEKLRPAPISVIPVSQRGPELRVVPNLPETPPIDAVEVVEEPEESVKDLTVEERVELLSLFEEENVKLEEALRALRAERDFLAQRADDAERAAAKAKEKANEKTSGYDALQQSHSKLHAAHQELLRAKERLNQTHKALQDDMAKHQENYRKGLENIQAHHKTEIDKLRAWYKKELEDLQEELQARFAATAKESPDKSLLLEWTKLLNGAKTGGPDAFAALLEFAAKVNISTAELLTLMRG